jgi:hypothetical protein
MASKIPVGATTPTHDVPAPKGERAEMLHRIGQCTSVLRDVLYDDGALDEEEFVFIDKHFQTLNMAYLRWKRKHRPTDEAHLLI